MQNLLLCHIVVPKFRYFRTENFYDIFLRSSLNIFIQAKGSIFRNPKRQISEKCTVIYIFKIKQEVQINQPCRNRIWNHILLQWLSLCCFHSNCQTMKNTQLGMRSSHIVNDHTSHICTLLRQLFNELYLKIIQEAIFLKNRNIKAWNIT